MGNPFSPRNVATYSGRGLHRVSRGPKRARACKAGRAEMAFGAAVVCLMILFALVGPLVVGGDPYAMNADARLTAPCAEYPMGTDDFGRDLLVRIMYGAQTSLAVGFSTAALSALLGLVVGVYASMSKTLDHVLMRICDGLAAIPGILLAIALMAVLGAAWQNVVVALVIVYTPSTARIVRSRALALKGQAYIEALRVQGASLARIVWLHIVPNVISPLLVQATTVFAEAILSEATLSFLGLGINPPQASWGGILQSGKTLIDQAWWMIAEPGACIIASALGLVFLGDGLRDALDPHSKDGE